MSKAILISDFNLANFSALLVNDEFLPKVETSIAPFGQVVQVLIDSNMPCWQENYDLAICWTQPQAVIESFNKALMNKPVSIDEILTEVDNYAKAILHLSDKVKTIFVPLWISPSLDSGNIVLDFKKDGGIANILLQMNARLAWHFQGSTNVYILDTQKWVGLLGKSAFNPKLWYMGKIAFTNELFKEAVKDIKAALQTISGQACKLIILDLDDTLWGGVVGDLGWQNIVLGGHDAVGEAYRDFQKALKALTNRGILLAIVSKNEESVGLEAIKNNPEMVLKIDDFVGYKINWQDKAKNIYDLTMELNLGLQSVVFIDDSPLERAWVKETLRQVLVPDWPAHPMLYKSALLALRCFDAVSVTREDAERTRMYSQESKRENLKNQLGSIEDWIKSLNIKIAVEELNKENLARAAQLFNKTNQMNLVTRRLSEGELFAWVNQPVNKIFVFRVSDKFGDYGLTALASLSFDKDRAQIADYILSCRVMGRKVEEAMVHVLAAYAKSRGAKDIVARYLPTQKNKPCLDFWRRSGFLEEHNNTFVFDCSKPYPAPDCLAIEGLDYAKK